MRLYLRLLSFCYALGFFLHLLDLLSLRLTFNELPLYWKLWILYLLIFDLLAAIGLWRGRKWGIAIFLIVACSQLVAYLGFRNYFGNQWFLVGFHVVTLGAFLVLTFMRSKGRLAK